MGALSFSITPSEQRATRQTSNDAGPPAGGPPDGPARVPRAQVGQPPDGARGHQPAQRRVPQDCGELSRPLHGGKGKRAHHRRPLALQELSNPQGGAGLHAPGTPPFRPAAAPPGGGGGCASVCYSTVCVLPNVHFMFYATSAAFPSRVFIQSISGGRLLKEGRHRRRVHLRRQVCGRELRPVPLVTGDDEHGQRGTQHQRLAILHHSQGTRWKKKPIAFST
jgi:hypothetical protein